MPSKKKLRKRICGIKDERNQAAARVTILEMYARRILAHLKDVDRETAPELWRDAYTLESVVERLQRQTPGYTLSELVALRTKLVGDRFSVWKAAVDAPWAQKAEQIVTNPNPGDPGTITHNHDFDPSCQERPVWGGALRGECLGDAA